MRTIGAVRTGRIHRLPRRTLYNIVARVEADEDLLTRARERQCAMADRFDGALADLVVTAVEALRADIAGGKISSRDLVGLLSAVATPKPISASTADVVGVPAVLATPRVDPPTEPT